MFYPNWPRWARKERIGDRVGMTLSNSPTPEQAFSKADTTLLKRQKNQFVWMTGQYIEILRKDALHVLAIRRRKARAARGAVGPRDL
jgi:hypothetical protein